MVEDDRFIAEPSHKVAMIVKDVVCGIYDVRKMQQIGTEFYGVLSLADADDLELAYSILGHILIAIRQRKREVVA